MGKELHEMSILDSSVYQTPPGDDDANKTILRWIGEEAPGICNIEGVVLG